MVPGLYQGVDWVVVGWVVDSAAVVICILVLGERRRKQSLVEVQVEQVWG